MGDKFFKTQANPATRTNGYSEDDESANFERHEDAREFYSPNRFFMLSLDFLEILDLDSAVMLAMLIRVCERVGADARREGWTGWFYYRADQAERELKFDRKKQARILDRLRKMKLIRYQRRGIPPKRYFWVDYVKIRECVKRSRKP